MEEKMTEASATASASPDGTRAFLQIWAESLAQVLGQISGSAIGCELLAERPNDLAVVADTDVWAVVTCSGGLRGEMSLHLTAASAMHLAQIFVGESRAKDEPAAPAASTDPTLASTSGMAEASARIPDEQREAVIELLRQIGGVSSAAKERWGEVQLGMELVPSAPSWAAAATFWLRAEEGSRPIVMEVGVSAALSAELRAEKNGAAKSVVYGAAPAADDAGSNAETAKARAVVSAGGKAAGLDALMDVKLSMTLRFGSKTLLLRDVLDLSPGAVVELDRKVQEPVELLLEGRIVARGDLVVIDHNYGLRVIEVSLGNAGRCDK